MIQKLKGILFFSILLVFSCQDPIPVGNDLLDEERLNIGVTDTFDLSSKTIEGTRVVTHKSNVDSRSYLLGQLDDPLFGKISSEIYMKFNLLSSTKPNYHLEQLIKFDSLVLVLLYDSTVTYGRTIATQKIEIFPLEQSFSSTDSFYSDFTTTIKPNTLASYTTVIRPKDSVSITDHVTRNIVRQAPQLRIRLNDDFGKALLDNEEAAKNDTAFTDFFKGIYIKSESPDNTPFMYGFNFTDAALSTQTPVNKLIMYYNVASGDTTLRKTYEYLINNVTINRFVHDKKGSFAEDLIANPTKGDSLTLIQGMAGVKTVIKFNDLNKLKGRLINKAELEVFVADLPDQNGSYAPPRFLIARYFNNNNLQFIPDISPLVSANIDFTTSFNGKLNSTSMIRKYTMNITNHIKNAVSNDQYSSDLYLGILTESELPNRAIFYGAKHSQYPMKLKITYTKN